MSSRFASEQLASGRRAAPRSVESAREQDQSLAFAAEEDVNAACRSRARLLITASTAQSVETLARRIHRNGPRARFPFVMTSAAELSVGAQALSEDWARFLEAAAGGTVFVRAVEEMPAAVQEELIDLFAAQPESSRPASAEVRLISGTTVSLLDRVAAGSFSEQLFYRLNVIHLMVGNGSPAAARA